MDNYFEFYGIPESFHPDQAAVKARYYELSRQYHPDRFAQAESAQRIESLTMASLNNKAYKTLTNPDATMAYLLTLNSVLHSEEKYNLPAAFLMEMMDINEAISDYESQPDNTTAREQVEQGLNTQFTEWQDAAETLTHRFDAGEKTNDLLLQIKDMYFRKKYLLRIQERIDKFAAR